MVNQPRSKNETGNAMVSQCANPKCRRELHYLRDGKIYQFVLPANTDSKRLEHFCLCGECSKGMILICVGQAEGKIVGKDGAPIPPYFNPLTFCRPPTKQ